MRAINRNRRGFLLIKKPSSAFFTGEIEQIKNILSILHATHSIWSLKVAFYVGQSANNHARNSSENLAIMQETHCTD